MSTKVAVIGAGNVGGNLGTRLSVSGVPVCFGVLEGADTKALLARCAPDASAKSPAEAAKSADVVFVAVPGSVAIEAVGAIARELEGKIVVDCNNTLTWDEGPVWAPPAEGSLTAALAEAAPGARLVKGFNTFGAEHHLDPHHAGEPGAEVFLAADDADAKTTVSELASKAGFRPVDAGPLRNAALLENLAILWIHMATVGGRGRDFVFGTRTRS